MILHPDHAMDLAAIRHRELLTQAEEFRAAARLRGHPAQAPAPDCRVPTSDPRVPAAAGRRRACRPDLRPGAADPAGSRRPRRGSLGHRKPHRAH